VKVSRQMTDFKIGATLVSCALLCGALSVLMGCSAPPARDPTTSRDPFAVVLKADDLTSQGQYDEALRDYLWALDHGRDVSSSFVAARRDLVEKIVTLGVQYPSAKTALAERLDAQAKRIATAMEVGPQLDGMDLRLFVWLGTKTGDEARVLATYAAVRANTSDSNRLRLYLWSGIEQYLVEQRRYRDAAKEPDGSALVNFYIDLFRPMRADARVQGAMQFSIEEEGGNHFEALLGAGETGSAEALAERLIQFLPTAPTFAALIRHARRLITHRKLDA